MGTEARHARAALERVQRTLERGQTVDAAAVLVPLRQRALRGVDELDGLVGEDAGDVLVEVREDVFDHVGGWRLLASGLLAAERKRGAPRPPARQEPAGAVRPAWGGVPPAPRRGRRR